MRMVCNAGLWALAAFALVPASAFAAQSTTYMNVGVTVSAACAISVTDINFGSVAASSLSAALTSVPANGGLLTYTCASKNTPALAASQGQNYATTNRMKGTLGGYLPYTLNLPTLAAFTGATQTAQITATIPAQGTLPAVDAYTDAVLLTLTY